MATCRCPTCDARFDPATSRAMPFCCERCRQIDLGRWLREQHTLRVLRTDVDEEDEVGEGFARGEESDD